MYKPKRVCVLVAVICLGLMPLSCGRLRMVLEQQRSGMETVVVSAAKNQTTIEKLRATPTVSLRSTTNSMMTRGLHRRAPRDQKGSREPE